MPETANLYHIYSKNKHTGQKVYFCSASTGLKGEWGDDESKEQLSILNDKVYVNVVWERELVA